MTWIIEHKEIAFAIFILAIMLAENVVLFIKEPKETKIASVKEWLLYAVTLAEKEYGSGTGVLKLHYVWNLACNTFTWLPKLISFETFSEWVDDALEWLRVQLSSNENVKTYVEGEKE